MKNLISAYYKDESAAEDVKVMLLTVAAIGTSIAVGWYIFDMIKGQTEKQKCNGSANPFCVE